MSEASLSNDEVSELILANWEFFLPSFLPSFPPRLGSIVFISLGRGVEGGTRGSTLVAGIHCIFDFGPISLILLIKKMEKRKMKLFGILGRGLLEVDCVCALLSRERS